MTKTKAKTKVEKGRSGRTHVPTKKTRERVWMAVALGIPIPEVAFLIGLGSEHTLKKHYKEEIERARHEANIAVGGQLYKKCMEGDTASILFWMKCRMRWKEKHDVEVSVTELPRILAEVGKKPSK